MQTSRDDFGIAIRSAFLRKGAQQRISLFVLIVFSITLLFIETIETKPLNYLRYFVKDTIYQGSYLISFPTRGAQSLFYTVKHHMNLNEEYKKIKEENIELKNQTHDPDFLKFENTQLRQLLDEQVLSSSNLVSARVMLDKQSPYLNSFIINSGRNKKIIKGLAALDGTNFVGRVVDVNFFSSRILLVTDLNSKIPIVVEPKGYHAILSGTGKAEPVLDFLPDDHAIESGNKVYTSGKEGIFAPGIPIGEARLENEKIFVSLFSDTNQITFINIKVE